VREAEPSDDGAAYGLILRAIEAYKVHPLPIVKAYADKIGLVAVITELVPSEMEVDPGTMVLGLVLDTLSGHCQLNYTPLYSLSLVWHTRPLIIAPRERKASSRYC
jgi:hypothetical protein